MRCDTPDGNRPDRPRSLEFAAARIVVVTPCGRCGRGVRSAALLEGDPADQRRVFSYLFRVDVCGCSSLIDRRLHLVGVNLDWSLIGRLSTLLHHIHKEGFLRVVGGKRVRAGASVAVEARVRYIAKFRVRARASVAVEARV